MTIVFFAALCAALVFAQDAVPGAAWYHQGSYAALLLALLVAQWWSLRGHFKRGDARAQALLLLTFGTNIIGIAGLASSLLAPDTQTLVRGPGEKIALSEPAGTLEFRTVDPILHRPGRSDTVIGTGRRTYLASYIMWTDLRPAAYIEAFDLRHRHLTVTQPANTSFLSPWLMFAQTTIIAGRSVPVDSFSLPGAHRNVKAVLLAQPPGPGILFAVENERAQLLRDGIRLQKGDAEVRAGDVILNGTIHQYPAVVIAAAPNVALLIAGFLAVAAGAGLMFRPRAG